MGGVMDESQSHLSLGLLAERMVLALGRAVRGEDPVGSDETVLKAARDLFHLMRSDDLIVAGRGPAARMFNDASYYDALHVVESEANGEGAEQVAEEYEALLTKVLDRSVGENDLDDLKTLRRVFSEVGEMTLARAYDASRASEDMTWHPARPPT